MLAKKRKKDNLFFGINLTDEQKIYVDAIFDNIITFVNAKSGTGKTTIAVAAAKLLGLDLLYLFNPVEERKMGHRPGTQEEKDEAYLTPLKDALLEIGESPMQAIFNESNQKSPSAWVVAESHIFKRGTNLKNKTIIIDEAQNWSMRDLKKVLTRVHDDCKVIVIGHTGQLDVKQQDSGFAKVIEHFVDEDYCAVCELTQNFRGKLSQRADELPDD